MKELPELKFDEPVNTTVNDLPDLEFEEKKPLKEFHLFSPEAAIEEARQRLKYPEPQDYLFPMPFQTEEDIKKATQYAKAAEQAIVGGINTALFGLPQFLLKKAGYKLPQPKTPLEAVARGGGELGGFIFGGPMKLGGKIAQRLPFVRRAFVRGLPLFGRQLTKTQALLKPFIRTATTLGTAEATLTPEEGFFAPKERAKQFVSGAKTGLAFAGLGFIPRPTIRILATSLYSGLPSTLRNEPLEQQVFNYGIGAWFGRHGISPQETIKAEQKAFKVLTEGIQEPDRITKLAKDNENILKDFKENADKIEVEKRRPLKEIVKSFFPSEYHYWIDPKTGEFPEEYYY
ncbi:MAG: hypothetical protein DRP74_08500, partial [Candidatus Omnitrophota bacterium]